MLIPSRELLLYHRQHPKRIDLVQNRLQGRREAKAYEVGRRANYGVLLTATKIPDSFIMRVTQICIVPIYLYNVHDYKLKS